MSDVDPEALAVTGRPTIATIVLAAGGGSRFGGLKQLAPVGGRPILGRVLEALEGVGEERVVVLGAEAERVRAAVGSGWRVVVAGDWEEGMGASLRAGLAAVPAADEALVVLGDLPWLRREAVERVLAAASGGEAEVVRAFDGETPGHPVLVRGEALARARSAPHEGLRAALRGIAVARVRCDGLGVARDVDTPADLEPPRRA